MPCMGPSENPLQVDKAYEEIMELLKTKYDIQKFPSPPLDKDWVRRQERNSYFKEALRKLFQLDSWEGF